MTQRTLLDIVTGLIMAAFFMALLAIGSCQIAAAQFSPNIDSLMTAWPAQTVSSARFANPADAGNYLDVWFNVEGAPRVVRYYDNDALLYACTLTAGCFATSSALRQEYADFLGSGLDETGRQRLIALIEDSAILDR